MLLLSLTHQDILKQRKFTDDELNLLKSLALEKLHRHRKLKKKFALHYLE